MPETYYLDKLYPLQDKILNVVEQLDLDFYLTGGDAAPNQLLENRGNSQFVDVAGNEHAAAIVAIAGLGITRGCNPPVNDRFCPDQAVTRGEMAAFLNLTLRCW